MSRRLPFFVLIGTAVAVGVLFFQVIWPFLFPMFFAAVMALLFYPLYERVIQLCRGRRRIAAGLTTVTLILAGALPICGAMYLVGQQLLDVGKELVDRDWERVREDWKKNEVIAPVLSAIEDNVTAERRAELQNSVLDGVRGMTSEVYDRTRAFISNVIGFVVGFVIMALSLYYFFADGPVMLQRIQQMSPMEDQDEITLFAEFERVCRGIVLATLVSAMAQAILAGIGFAVAGVGRIWLLSGLTMMFSMVPFLGATAIWLPVALYQLVEQRYLAGGFLIIYGAALVSTSDNVIKAHVIHGRSNLHPLVVLITILGGLRVVGLWGIFIGPVVAAFFYALLKILHERVQGDHEANLDTSGAPTAKSALESMDSGVLEKSTDGSVPAKKAAAKRKPPPG